MTKRQCIAAAVLVLTAALGAPADAATRPTQPTLGPGVRVANSEAQMPLKKLDHPRLHRLLGLDPRQRLVLKDRIVDADGTRHVRFNRTLSGLPVVGGDLVVHALEGQLVDVDWASVADLSVVDTSLPRVTVASATREAAAASGLVASPERTRLVVYAVDDAARLAYESVAVGRSDRPEQVAVYVDAATGEPITSLSLVPAIEGKGKSLYNGKVALETRRPGTRYQLVDATRGDQSVYDAEQLSANAPLTGMLFKDRDNVWGDFTPEHRQSAAADAAYGSAVTWDYFLAKFDRRGIRNDGVGARSFVHVGHNLDDAYWVEDCFCMAYGDGGTTYHPLVALDVVGHEMSHGVTNDTAGLIYVGESGALSEATSDIFGTAIEFFADNPDDPGDYLIGEEVTKGPLGFRRRLDKPSLDGISADCWRPNLGADDVHFSSGPANHFFFLLAEGSGSQRVGGVDYSSPTCNDTTVTGIGRTPAAQIWYRALTVHLTSTSGYREARDATIRAARSLYGADSQECRRVVKAWDAVAVPPGSYGCSGSALRWGYNALKNGGFEQGKTRGWSADKGVITQNPSFFGPHTGRWYGSLNNAGSAQTESVAQSFRVPGTPTAMLRFHVAIFSSDSPSLRHDTLAVTLTDETGREIALRTLDNTDANASYTPYAINLGPYAGEMMTLTFTGQEDATAATAFLIDDVLATPQ